MADNYTPASPRAIELAVMSRPAAGGGLTPGHIMIVTAIAGVGENAWGFYPDGVRDEIVVGKWERYSNSTVLNITMDQYQQLLKEIDEFKNRTKYHLFSTNCVFFVRTMLAKIGITIPEDTLWPNNQGKEFVKLYGESWGSCLAQ